MNGNFVCYAQYRLRLMNSTQTKDEMNSTQTQREMNSKFVQNEQ